MSIATQTQPFIKWAGGKTRLLPIYEKFFPKKFNNYYEPFLGGGAIFFYLKSRDYFIPEFQQTLTDINPQLIRTYQAIRDCPSEVIALLEYHARAHCEEYYYQLRGMEFDSLAEIAAQFIYLNKTCYNGLYRVNKRGGFNVPFGHYKNPTICNREAILNASHSLRDVGFSIKPYDWILGMVDPGDFVYLDPPYAPVRTKSFTTYSDSPFGEREHIRLRNIFDTLAAKGVKVILSNSDTEFTRDIYAGLDVHVIQAPRSINSDGAGRGLVSELLVVANYDQEDRWK